MRIAKQPHIKAYHLPGIAHHTGKMCSLVARGSTRIYNMTPIARRQNKSWQKSCLQTYAVGETELKFYNRAGPRRTMVTALQTTCMCIT